MHEWQQQVFLGSLRESELPNRVLLDFFTYSLSFLPLLLVFYLSCLSTDSLYLYTFKAALELLLLPDYIESFPSLIETNEFLLLGCLGISGFILVFISVL